MDFIILSVDASVLTLSIFTLEDKTIRKTTYPPLTVMSDTKGNFFPTPNGVFSIGLDFREIALYSYLLYKENRETFQCFPSFRTIGDAIGMSRNTVMKYVGSLEEKKLIETEPTSIVTRDGQKLNGNLLYTLLPFIEAVGYYNEQQLKHIDEQCRMEAMAEKHPAIATAF